MKGIVCKLSLLCLVEVIFLFDEIPIYIFCYWSGNKLYDFSIYSYQQRNLKGENTLFENPTFEKSIINKFQRKGFQIIIGANLELKIKNLK